MKLINQLIAVCLLGIQFFSFSQVTGDYRTNSSSTTFGSATNWQRWNGSSWATTTIAPQSATFTSSNTITIRSSHTAKLESSFQFGGILDVYGEINLSSGFLQSTSLKITNTGKIIFRAANAKQLTSSTFFSSNEFNLESGATLTTYNVHGIYISGNNSTTTSLTPPSSGLLGSNSLSLNTSANYEFLGATQNVNGLPTTVKNLVLGGSGTKAGFPSSQNISESLSIATNVTMTAPTTLTIGANLTNNGTYNAGSGTVSIGGNLTNNGTFNTNTGTVNFNGTTLSEISGSSIPVFYNLTVSNSARLKPSTDITVNGILNMSAPNPNATDGVIDMVVNYGAYATVASADNTDQYNNLNSHILNLGPNATVTGNGDVTGKVRRNSFVSGTSYSFNHKNMSLTFNNTAGGVLPNQITLVQTRGDHGLHVDKAGISPNPAIGGPSVKRMWQILRTGGDNNVRFTVNFPYEDGELNGNSEADLVTWDHHLDAPTPYAGTTPHEHGKTSLDIVNNIVGLSNHSVFYLTAEGSTTRTKYWMISKKVSTELLYLGAAAGADLWNINSNWSSGSVPSQDTSIVIKAGTYNIPLNIKDYTKKVGTIEIKEGASFTIEGGNLILRRAPGTVSNNSGTWVNMGTFNAGTGKVTFDVANASYAGTTNFHNIEVTTGSSLILQTNSVLKIGNQIINNGTIDASSFPNTIVYNGNIDQTTVGLPNTLYNLTLEDTNQILTLDKALTLKGSLTINENTELDLDSKSITLEGDFENNGTFTHSGGPVVFSGNSAKSLKGSNETTFHTLTMNGSGPLNMAVNGTVSNTLNLTTGLIKLGDQTLSFSGTTIEGGNATSYVNTEGLGKFKHMVNGNGVYKLPVGSDEHFSPAKIEFTSIGTTGSTSALEIKTNEGVPVELNNVNEYVNRTWNIEPIDLSDYTYSAHLQYDENELSVGASEQDLVAVKFSEGAWNKPVNSSFEDGEAEGISISEPSTNMVNWTGLSSFSQFVIVGNNNTPLPITLTSFTAKCQTDCALISWTTASENNALQYVLEKSKDGYIWEAVTRIDAVGTTNQTSNYFFKDVKEGQVIYYRLVQYDVNGNFEVYDPISILCFAEEKTLINIVNTLGQPVDINTKGLIILIFSNGESIKIINY